MTDNKKLAALAVAARKNAYVPYSHFSVGAAVLCSDGTVYTGCNIENGSFGATICAERVALTKAISDGRRSFDAIAIAADNGDDYIVPCGICRQFMSEFFSAGTTVLQVKNESDFLVNSFGNLFPSTFTLNK